MPKISVIIPVYKVEKYIGKCIESVLAQTYSDFELILIDDGTPDQSGDICDDYAKKDNRIHVYHKENGGVSSARNFGIKKAQGEWLCFIDSDDYVGESYLKDFNVGEITNSMPIQGFCLKSNNTYEVHCIPSECKMQSDIFYHAEMLNIIVSPWCKLFSTKIIRDNNLHFDQRTSYGEDHLFVLNYLRFIESINSNIAHSYTYNQTPQDSLSRGNVPREYFLYYIENIVKLLEEISSKLNLKNDQKKCILNKRIYRHWIKIILSFTKDKDIKRNDIYSTLKRLKGLKFSTTGLCKKHAFILLILYFSPATLIYIFIVCLRYYCK